MDNDCGFEGVGTRSKEDLLLTPANVDVDKDFLEDTGVVDLTLERVFLREGGTAVAGSASASMEL